jgi:hypothetical protein
MHKSFLCAHVSRLSRFEFIIDDEYEKQVVREYDLVNSDDRELNIAGAYTPVQGIYSLGWKGWQEQPYSEFVRSIIDWHNSFIKEHSEVFYPDFSPAINRGEPSMEDLKAIFFSLLPRATELFMWEGLAHNRAHRMGAREARDLIARHLFEETGHAEMMFDFVAGAFNLDRVRDLYPLNNPHNFSEPLKKWYKNNQRRNAEGHFVEVAAASMLSERWIPKAYNLIGQGLRKHYNVPNKYLTFMDVHSYIDIYHQRFGAYLLSKYASTKELQERAEKEYKNAINGLYEYNRSVYEGLQMSRR